MFRLRSHLATCFAKVARWPGDSAKDPPGQATPRERLAPVHRGRETRVPNGGRIVMAPPRYRQLVRATLATTLPRRLLLVRGPAAGGSVCLTFDDGPHPENTPAVLDVLKKEGVSATFFVIGQRAQRYPRL